MTSAHDYVADTRDDDRPSIIATVFTWVQRAGSFLAVVAALANFGDRLIEGLGLAVTLVDVYRAVIYPVEDFVFGRLGFAPTDRPLREVIDLFVVILFSRNLILSFFLRDILRANGAPRRGAFFISNFTGIYVDNYLSRIWFPILLTYFYWVQGFLVRELFQVPITSLQVLLAWGLLGFFKGIFTSDYSTLPRWFTYPYITYRVAYTGLKPIPSMFRRYHFWALLIILPIIFELNQRADTALPFVQRIVEASRDIMSDLRGHPQQ